MKTKQDFEMRYVIRSYRMALGLSQADVGFVINRSSAWISMNERGKIDASKSDAAKMKSFLIDLRNKKGLSKEYYDAKATLLLCEVYADQDGVTPPDVYTYAQRCCGRFANSN